MKAFVNKPREIMNDLIVKVAYKLAIVYFKVTYSCIVPGAHPELLWKGGGGGLAEREAVYNL
jgi:hypothetical protein